MPILASKTFLSGRVLSTVADGQKVQHHDAVVRRFGRDQRILEGEVVAGDADHSMDAWSDLLRSSRKPSESRAPRPASAPAPASTLCVLLFQLDVPRHQESSPVPFHVPPQLFLVGVARLPARGDFLAPVLVGRRRESAASTTSGAGAQRRGVRRRSRAEERVDVRQNLLSSLTFAGRVGLGVLRARRGKRAPCSPAILRHSDCARAGSPAGARAAAGVGYRKALRRYRGLRGKATLLHHREEVALVAAMMRAPPRAPGLADAPDLVLLQAAHVLT